VSDRCEEGLDRRCRDENGSIRRKRGDTLAGTLRQEYGPDFAAVNAERHEARHAS